MNKYLEKIASGLSDENKHVLKTFAGQQILAIPAHAGGAAIGAKIGKKFGHPVAGATVGGLVTGGVVDLAALKYGIHKGKQE